LAMLVTLMVMELVAQMAREGQCAVMSRKTDLLIDSSSTTDSITKSAMATASGRLLEHDMRSLQSCEGGSEGTVQLDESCLL